MVVSDGFSTQRPNLRLQEVRRAMHTESTGVRAVSHEDPDPGELIAEYIGLRDIMPCSHVASKILKFHPLTSGL